MKLNSAMLKKLNQKSFVCKAESSMLFFVNNKSRQVVTKMGQGEESCNPFV